MSMVSSFTLFGALFKRVYANCGERKKISFFIQIINVQTCNKTEVFFLEEISVREK
jgi:hypothetical protein